VHGELYFRITQPVDKKDALLIYGSKEIVRLNKRLKNGRAEELDEYAVLKNKHHARYTFLSTKQERREKIGSYVSRLREKGFVLYILHHVLQFLSLSSKDLCLLFVPLPQ
jgi:hypothetical protein